MSREVRWYRSLAWKFFLRTSVTILVIIGVLVFITSTVADRKARESAGAQMLSASQVVDRTFEQQGKIMDAGLEVFTQYSANLANIEKGDYSSVRDTLLDNLSRLNSQIAVVIRPSGALLSCTTDGVKQDYNDVGIVQMAMYPDEARKAGYPGPSYRGFFKIDEGKFKGVYHAVARSISTPGGASLGVMLVGNSLSDEAAKELRFVSLPPGRKGDLPPHFGLLSQFQIQGLTVADASQRDALQRAISTGDGFKAAQAGVLAGQRSATIPVALEGRPYLAVLAPLKGVNALDLRIADVVMMPLEPFLAPFVTIRNVILATGAGGLLLAMIFSLTSSRAVTSPLSALARATAQLAEGERPEIPALNSQDEVGYLTQAFRAMLSELKAKDELLAALEHLDPKDGRRGMGAEMESVAQSRVSMSAVDVDATIMLATTSQVMRGEDPSPQRKRVTLKEGEIFAGRYRIENILGKGGMGIVLKAHDQQLDEDVALKIIRPEHDLSTGFLEQLKQEIKLARKITNKYVLRTHDFGEFEGLPFVSMEYLKGVTLKQLLDDRGSLPIGLVLRIGRQVSEGLEAAHGEGVVHRDIKPLNILFDARGDAKIMDFGLAAPVAAKGSSAEGQVFGTPRYMSPEQVRGERVDPRTDLYALGVMLFELSTGFPPFEHAVITELLRMHLSTPVPRAKELAPDLPEGFSFLLERLMAKRIEDRPASAMEVVEILKLLAAGGSGETKRVA
ncbi:MAG: protein kinase [Holophagaceae bacterium]|nr:protein kinase [Holophagaceae bacterium]